MVNYHNKSGESQLSIDSLSIPMVNNQIHHNNRVTTPEWMIQMDSFLSSSVEGFDNFAELYGWSAEQARLTKGNTADQFFSTASVQHSNIIVVLPAGIYIPTLETKMNMGSNIALIKIVRLSNNGDTKQSNQEIEFTNCKIESMRQELDKIIVSFRPETRQNKIIQYGQDGSKMGQAVTKYDYTTGTQA